MARGPANTMVPMVRDARDHIASLNEGLVTAREIKERLERSAESMKILFRTMDPESARAAQQAQATKTALIEWPSYRGKDGEFVHLDPQIEHPSHVWLKVLSYRKERVANAEQSEANAENLYREALYREQLEAGVERPVVENVRAPLEAELTT